MTSISIRSFFSILLAVGILGGVGCSKSSSTDDADGSAGENDAGTQDGAIAIDGSTTDAGTADAGPLCPNGAVDLGEECDDGNTVDDDDCSNACIANSICGNGDEEPGEGCDDGDNQSGDGCDGLCRVEMCGNARLDVGEICDGTPGCAATCDAVTTCGNGDVDAGEQCDDENTTSWDGCSAACETEKSVAISDLAFSDVPPDGCDVNGDGDGDNALGVIISSLAQGFIEDAITTQLAMPPFIVLSVMGAGDATFASDPNVRVAWLSATDADGNAGNDFDGSGTIHVAANTVNGAQPLLSFGGSIAAMVANVGPEDVTLPFLNGAALGLKRAYIVDTTFAVDSVSMPPRYSVGALGGHLCGTLPVTTVAAIPNFLGLAGAALPMGATLPTSSCAQATVPDDQVNMADVFAGGATASYSLGPITIPLPVIVAQSLDVDFDGDGLEVLEVQGGTNCQPVIVACIDGDGTRIEGHACVNDARIVDGWSAAFDFTAANVRFVP